MTNSARADSPVKRKTIQTLPNLFALQADLGKVLLGTSSMREMLNRCAELIVEDVDVSFARIWTLNEAENMLELQASAGLYTHIDGPHSRIKVGHYKIGLIAQERLPHLTNKVIGDPRVSDQEWAKREKMVAFVGYPLLIENQLLGVLGAFSKKALARRTMDAIGAAADYIALGIRRKLSEESLRENEEFIRRVLASSSECVKVLDLDRRIRYMNPGGMKLLEIDDFGSCENGDWCSFWQEQDAPKITVAIDEAMAGRMGTFHAFCPTFKGTPKWWDVVVSPIRDAEGNVVRLLASSRDVTERKNAEIAERQNVEKLAAMVEERTADLRHQVNERQRAENDLRKLSSTLLTLRDKEQRRIARDLHDSVGQLLAATAMTLAVVGEESSKLSSVAAKALADSADLVQETVKEVRVVSQLLHPPLLDEAGIVAALRMYVDGISARGDLKVELTVADDFGRLLVDLETAIFRIVQECLTNIHRHSGSKTARIELDRRSGEIRVEVSDQGKGMPAREPSGVGLRGMRERVAQFGGALEIHSSATGCRIVARLPLN
jgi:signal transduction histidine kinase